MGTKETYWKNSLIVMILVLGIVIFIELIPFLGGLLGACTIYVLLRGQMCRLTGKRKMRRSLAAILLLGETILCFLVPLSLIVWMLLNKIQHLNLDPQTVIAPIEHISQLIEERTGYDLFQSGNIASVAAFIPKVGQYLMSGISSFSLNIFALIFVLYFMLIGGEKMEGYINDLLPFSDKNKKEVLDEIYLIVRSNAIGIPLLAIIQGAIALTGYYIFSVPSPLFFGVLTCFATIIPIVGTGLVWVPLTIYLALSGEWGMALGLLLYSVLVLAQVDNLIRFILQKKMADIHPLITIFGVVIGLPLFGFMGIIFGPLLLSMFILCIHIFKTEYLEKEN